MSKTELIRLAGGIRITIYAPTTKVGSRSWRVHARDVPRDDDVGRGDDGRDGRGGSRAAGRRGDKLAARSMVGRFGMSDEIGFVSVLPQDGEDQWWQMAGFSQVSDGTRHRVDEGIKRSAGDAHGRTVRLRSENRHRLETLAEELSRAEALDAPDAYPTAGIDWPAGRDVEREESGLGVHTGDGSKCLMLSPTITPCITPRSPP